MTSWSRIRVGAVFLAALVLSSACSASGGSPTGSSATPATTPQESSDSVTTSRSGGPSSSQTSSSAATTTAKIPTHGPLTLAGTIWDGTDVSFDRVRVKFLADGSALVWAYPSASSSHGFEELDGFGSSRYRWSITGSTVTFKDKDTYSWVGDVHEGVMSGTATYIRGGKHAFTLRRVSGSTYECPTRLSLRNSLPKGMTLAAGQPKIVCLGGWAFVSFETTESQGSWQELGYLHVVGSTWRYYARSDGCSRTDIPQSLRAAEFCNYS